MGYRFGHVSFFSHFFFKAKAFCEGFHVGNFRPVGRRGPKSPILGTFLSIKCAAAMSRCSGFWWGATRGRGGGGVFDPMVTMYLSVLGSDLGTLSPRYLNPPSPVGDGNVQMFDFLMGDQGRGGGGRSSENGSFWPF